ncbi:IgGFc-binding protein [Bradymonas sediminis]|uniref:IgGFc-binding protein N-terminal domain-containing protein n=1 Tax=Bradymonas sediminis TaxID=1548548 RepID=A0A2Z4FNB7_9DELT|nr:IgGFc-binding protein [Bradymonas sediminis]AWV90511.1 hypothetical protein DN745_14720 [Bradymonas sediminis]TDP72096.1 hypothetical protein DFR33_10776 [Bradymonas sediminis]
MSPKYLCHALILSALLLLMGSGCSDNNPGDSTADTSVSDTPDATDPDTSEPVACEPNELLRCTEENTPGTLQCNSSGEGTHEARCPEGSVCRDAACVSVFCVPGSTRCDSPEQSQICNEEGTAWVDRDTCSGGDRCEAGYCLNRCEVANATGSYIGCEYWAVELENHLLDDSGPPETNDERAPFAVVLANTSETYDAYISVYTGPDEFAQAVGSRTVESPQFNGIDLVTVHSEVLGPNGNRLYGPISGDINRLILPRGSLMTLLLPYRSLAFGESSLGQKAYRVESTQPVVAYQFNPICCNYSHTNDASLLLPTSALTPNYMFLSYSVLSNGNEPFSSTLTVLATEPDTTVTIKLRTPKGRLGDPDEPRPYSELYYPFDSAADARVNGPSATGQFTVTMQPHEVLNLAGAGVSPVEDLTGALIEASAPIAVFGGHTCAYAPFSSPACDHLESQLFPLETWGQRFMMAPLKLRQSAEQAENTREGTYWKFLARANNTEINVGIDINRPNVLGPADEGVRACSEFARTSEAARAGTFNLNAGETCEFGTRELFVAEASHPIMIGAFISGQNSVTNNADWGSHAGDPSFYMVPPEEQYRSSYAFLTPATYFQSYVTVTTYPGNQITLDGEVVDLESHDYSHNTERGVLRAHIPVDPGPHTIKGQLPFGIVVYGYDDYVSYTFTGGLNFKKLTPWN